MLMGATCNRQAPHEVWSRHVPVPVTLHVYDIGTAGGSMLNRVLKPLGAGAFHCGVDVYGWEWSFSDISSPSERAGTGVFSSRPRNCEGHSYSESVRMGKTPLSEMDVHMLISAMEKEWPVAAYDLLQRNCCHFCDELCQRLGVGKMPAWINNLATAGHSLFGDVTDTTCCKMVAFEVADTMCCRASPSHERCDDHLVEAIPALHTPSTVY